MGFGTLFVGYVFLLSFVYTSITDFIAACLLTAAAQKLSPYHPHLRLSKTVSLVFLCLSASSALLEGLRMAGVCSEDFSLGIFGFLTPMKLLVEVFLLLYLFKGMEALATETDLPDLVKRAVRCRYFNTVLFCATLAFSLPLSFDFYKTLCTAAFLPLFVLRVAVGIVTAVAIWKFYMYICLPDDVDMQRKKTGIRWLDERLEKEDRRQEEKIAKDKAAMADLYHEREEKYRKNKKDKK